MSWMNTSWIDVSDGAIGNQSVILNVYGLGLIVSRVGAGATYHIVLVGALGPTCSIQHGARYLPSQARPALGPLSQHPSASYKIQSLVVPPCSALSTRWLLRWRSPPLLGLIRSAHALIESAYSRHMIFTVPTGPSLAKNSPRLSSVIFDGRLD